MKLVVALATLALVTGPTFAKDAQCRDAKGHYAKCPPKAAPATSSAAATGGATAKCKDGTLSHSKTHSGACSHHGGVASWQ